MSGPWSTNYSFRVLWIYMIFYIKIKCSWNLFFLQFLNSKLTPSKYIVCVCFQASSVYIVQLFTDMLLKDCHRIQTILQKR